MQPEKLDWTGITFPVSLRGKEISTFEKNNKIGVSVYACGQNEYGKETVYRERCPQEKFGKVISLFLIKLPVSEDFEYHFGVVKSLLALLREGVGKTHKVTALIVQESFTTRIRTSWRMGKRKGHKQLLRGVAYASRVELHSSG